MEQPTNPVCVPEEVERRTFERSVLAFRCELAHEDALLPTRGTPGSAGHDLYNVEEVTIAAGHRKVIKIGIKVAIPQGCYGRIAPRSGLAVKHGFQTMAGVIDSDYRGEVGVVGHNGGSEEITFPKHTRIAQLILERIDTQDIVQCAKGELDRLWGTERGNGGFGSTGAGK